jgi:hypothetical protein
MILSHTGREIKKVLIHRTEYNLFAKGYSRKGAKLAEEDRLYSRRVYATGRTRTRASIIKHSNSYFHFLSSRALRLCESQLLLVQKDLNELVQDTFTVA